MAGDFFRGCQRQYVNDRSSHSKGPIKYRFIHQLLNISCAARTMRNKMKPLKGGMLLYLSNASK